LLINTNLARQSGYRPFSNTTSNTYTATTNSRQHTHFFNPIF